MEQLNFTVCGRNRSILSVSLAIRLSVCIRSFIIAAQEGSYGIWSPFQCLEIVVWGTTRQCLKIYIFIGLKELGSTQGTKINSDVPVKFNNCILLCIWKLSVAALCSLLTTNCFYF